MPQENRSEVTRLLAAIQAEQQAAEAGLAGLAIVSQHAFITARMEQMGQYHDQLTVLVGHTEATRFVAETIWKPQESSQDSVASPLDQTTRQ